MEKSQLENYHVHYGPAQGWSQVDLHEQIGRAHV